MSTVNRTVPADLSLDKRFLPLNELETLNNSIAEKLSLLAEVRIPFQGMNVEQHCSTGIGDICTVNASICSTCQTLNKKKKKITAFLKLQAYFNKLQKKNSKSQSFHLGIRNFGISATTKETDLIHLSKVQDFSESVSKVLQQTIMVKLHISI